MAGHDHEIVRTEPDEAVTVAIREIIELEAALGLEIVWLQNALAFPETTKPLWWLRTMLVRWACRPSTRRMHAPDLLAGLTCALEDFDDQQLGTYLKAVEMAARRTA